MTTPDFSQRTFLERVSLAAREPVYSAAFAWLLEDRSPVPLPQRLAIVAAVSGADVCDGRGISATTEWNDVDLLLTVDCPDGPLHVAVENKIKAVEGAGQLAVYDSRLRELPGTVKKVFLSLTGEAPGSGDGWGAQSYSVLLEALLAQPVGNNDYVRDLCCALARLVGVVQAARDNAGDLAATAFDGEKQIDVAVLPPQLQHLAIRRTSATDIASYVREMRLEKVVQRIWMADLAAELGVCRPWRTAVGETRGQALLNVEAELQDLPGYLVGIQLQWRTLKAFCAPYPYPRRASDDQHRTVQKLLETIRTALGLDANVRPSSCGARGFRSFSVATLPHGRRRDEWLAVVRPHYAGLVSAFPSVRAAADAGLLVQAEGE